MSRSEKRRKREQREQLRSMAVAQRTHVRRTDDDLDRAAWLIEDREYDEARQILEECDRSNPGRSDVLFRLLDVYQGQGDYSPYCRTCERLLALLPENRSLHLTLAGGYAACMRGSRALQAYHRFIERWPGDPLADQAREAAEALEPIVAELRATSPFAPGDRVELVALHEDVLASISAGEAARTIELAERLLARAPEFIPAMNNLAHAYFECGRSDEAVAMSRRVLEREPGNFNALGNLARHLLLCGRRAEAERIAAQLRIAQSEHADIWSKKAETFSFLGDDRAVVEALDAARDAGFTRRKLPQVATLLHLGAVAHARLGDERQARRYWREALKIQPGFDLARENLADADKPVSERHGPWPYSMNYWIRCETLEALKTAFENAPTGDAGDESESRTAARFLSEHPQVASIVPLLLDRGDEHGRQLACRLARISGTPEMLEALLAFCLSRRGPDSLRIEIANYLYGKAVFPAGRVGLWVDGRVREIELLGFTITDEPAESGYSREVLDWTYDAMQALQRGDGRTAEGLLKKSLEVAGDQPDLLNNLANAYLLQGKTEECHQLARAVHARWPDYFFGVTFTANTATFNGDYARAEELLYSLSRIKHYHRTEFNALCTANIQLYLRMQKRDAVRSWLEMWKQVDPDHPDIARFERSLKFDTALGSLANLFGGWRRRDANHDAAGASSAKNRPAALTHETQDELFE